MDVREQSYRIEQLGECLDAAGDWLTQAMAWAAVVGAISDPRLRERALRAAEHADRLSRRSSRVVGLLRSATSAPVTAET